MRYLIRNDNSWSLSVALNMLKFFGFLIPGDHSADMKIFLSFYWVFWFFTLCGSIIIIQTGDLVVIWGDLRLMVSASFLLFTNVALGMKMINVVMKRDAIQKIIDESDDEIRIEDRAEGKIIIDECNRETSRLLKIYFILSGITVLGWAGSAEKNSLPLRAWYPFDETKSPAYEVAYCHQTLAVLLAAALNISLDTLATSLIALCRCRLKLQALTLKNVCSGIVIGNKPLFNSEQDKVLVSRLRPAVVRHQATLRAVLEIQYCFSEPILAQFVVSTIIICVTAYDLATALQEDQLNFVRLIAMTAYLVVMTLQVFLYCYQGNQLMMESTDISYAAYECPWYLCSFGFRQALLIVMTRTRRDARLTAGGFTSLSLVCFMSIVKLSYTFFTVLKQVEDRHTSK